MRLLSASLSLLSSSVLLAGCIVLMPRGPRTCEVDGDCAWDEYCSGGDVCVEALDRTWSMTVAAAFVGWSHPDGAAWDVDFSPPDLFAEFGVEDHQACVTAVALDSYDAWWSATCDVFLAREGGLYIDLWEADVTADEFVASWFWGSATEVMDLVRAPDGWSSVTDPSGTCQVDFLLSR